MTLFSRVEALLHDGRLVIQKDLKEAEAPKAELLKFRSTVTSSGYADDNAMTVNSCDWSGYAPSVTSALQTFWTHPSSMRWLGHSVPDTVAKLKNAKEFEICANPSPPLSFWYNGMLAACYSPDKVIAQLI